MAKVVVKKLNGLITFGPSLIIDEFIKRSVLQIDIHKLLNSLSVCAGLHEEEGTLKSPQDKISSLSKRVRIDIPLYLFFISWKYSCEGFPISSLLSVYSVSRCVYPQIFQVSPSTLI